MHPRRHQIPFLLTLKGVFLLGFIFGVMSVMTLGFLILAANVLNAAR